MSAKEMFEKLGYELTLDNEYGIIMKKNTNLKVKMK